ncbi:phage major capsid protein [Methylosinus sporium]|uniref:Phage major capsid protein n=2 Tax=Methylosinus sporium TaxID=428 RepID=A0A2U1SSR6_METSR|nr:phage major capsid protein [Methylosinus sporium]PWB94668.1 phage major capsid protein [Methylosinus sporium]
MEPEEIKSAVDKAVNPVMTAFEQFKAANDARLAEIEKKGSADPLLDEKLGKIEKRLGDFEGLNQKLTLAEGQAKAAREAADRIEVAMARIPGAARGGGSPGEVKQRANDWLRSVVSAHTLGIPNLGAEQRKSIEDAIAEYKSLNVSSDTAGGYLAPLEYVREIIKGVTEQSPVRALVRVRTTAAKSIQIPKRTGQFAAQWVAEQGTKSETTGLAYGLEEIPAHEIFALIDISNQMLEDSAFDMESELRMEAEEQFAVAEGAAVISGSGVGKSQGVLVHGSVAETNSGSAAAITADGVLSLFYGIKTAYARAATWGMNRSTIGAIRKLKDGDGQYLWSPGLANGVPNSINGAPYVELPDMPDIAANAYPVVFGDWRRAYTLVDRISMEFLRDPYTQATGGNVRFIFRRRQGGQVVLPEAIRKLKIAA